MPGPTGLPKALRDLDLLVVAKDLFLSDWMTEFSGIGFGSVERDELRRMAHETRQERSDLTDVIRRWGDALSAAGEGPVATGLARQSRIDLLETLLDAKIAAGESLERASNAAPRHLADEFLRLAAIDFRHANHLRGMIHRLRTEDLPPDALDAMRE